MDPVQIIRVSSIPRLRVRRVDEKAAVRWAVVAAKEQRRPVIDVEHGGTVANAYKHKADTEAVFVVAFPNGDAYCEVNRVSANKASEAGVAAAAFEGARPLFDGRYKDPQKLQKAREATIEWAKAELYPRPPEPEGPPLEGWGGFPLGDTSCDG